MKRAGLVKTVLDVAERALGSGPVGVRDRAKIWTTTGLAVLGGERTPSYFVLGYPKTGTNWVCNLLSGYLGVPVYEFWTSPWPRRGPIVLHMHRFLPFASTFRRTLYVMRDGRDVVLSDYHHRMRDRAGDPVLADELDHYLGAGFDPADVQANLPGFIRYLVERTLSSTDYATHLARGLARPYTRVRYEDLVDDTEGALATALSELVGGAVDAERVSAAVEAQRFENVSGRERGEEDPGSFLRSGVAGGWRGQFTREAAELYDAYAGDVLIRSGYERDHAWVAGCPRG